ncbi:MAG: TrkA family potassium uptake protein [Chloroflexaceae bacterium]|nr:TrkA family potassium uptake protein [Chloroflexaceae bacterium]
MSRQNGKRQEFAVIGLGRFGTSLALTLVDRGYYVMGIDRERDIVQRIADNITQAVILDSTDEDALRAVDIQSFDTVVVSIGSQFECNLMTTVALKNIGVPKVVCKATTKRQRDILLRVGADQVVLPEHDAGRRLAHVLAGPGVLDQLELEPGYSITELRVPDSLVGHTLIESDLRRRCGVNVLVVKNGSSLTISPDGDYVFDANDLLVVLGSDDGIAQLHELT